MHPRYSDLTSGSIASAANKSIPFLSTAEMDHLHSPPPRASSLRAKLISMHSKSTRRYDKPTKPTKEPRITLTQKYSQKHRRSVQIGAASSANILGKHTSTSDKDETQPSPETRAKLQLRAQQQRGPDRKNKASLGPRSPSNRSYNPQAERSTGLLTQYNMELHEEDHEEREDAETSASSPTASGPSRRSSFSKHSKKKKHKKSKHSKSNASNASNASNISKQTPNNAITNERLESNATNENENENENDSLLSDSNNGLDLELDQIPEYGSEDDLDWGTDSDGRDLQDDYEARALLATPQSPQSPLQATSKAVFFEEFRKLSRRNEIEASTMSADYLSSVIAHGLPPEPLHVGRGKDLSDISHRFRANDLDGVRLASLDAQFDLRGLQMGDGYVHGVGSSLKHGGSGTCSLLLGNNRISPRGASSLLDQLGGSNFSTVLHLDLSDNNIGIKGVHALVEGVTKLPGEPGSLHLRHLDISKNNLNDALLSTLINGLADANLYNRTLRTFVADRNTGSRQTCVALENYLCGDHKLKYLSMAWNRLGTQGGNPMLASGLLENNTLKVLNLAWNALGSSNDFALVGEAISRHTTLEHVDLSHNHITSTDVVTLSNDMDKNHTILGMHLAGNTASVDSLGFITAGEDLPSLNSSVSTNKTGANNANNGNKRSSNKRHHNRNKRKLNNPPKKRKKWKAKQNKTYEKTVIQQVLHALYMLWMESGMKPYEIFLKMDTDNDGTITATEFREGLKVLGLNIDGSDASIVFKEMDKDNSGGLVYKELLSSIKEAGKHPPPIARGSTAKSTPNADDAALYRSQVENGKLAALDHIHSSHISKDPRGGGVGGGNGSSGHNKGGGRGIMSELGQGVIHSCCWVCSGYKEEIFTFDVPRGSADEALEDVAICFDFEDYIPRETEKQDTRTATVGGVRFVARRVVPPGDLRYYFLVNGVARHNPDDPSATLDIKSMIKKKRPVTAKGNSWSKIASKYTTRPRCNTRTVAFRTGYLITRFVPRPTGLTWDDFKDIEEEIVETTDLDSNKVNGVEEEKEGEEEEEGKRKEKVRIISVEKTSEIIAHIWEKKARYDKVQRDKKRDHMALYDYADQYFRTEFGVKTGNQRMVAFEHGVRANWQSSSRIRWFATLIGWAPLRIDKDFDTPPDADAAAVYTTILMTCLPMDSIEERMIAAPCMVDFTVLSALMGAGNKQNEDLNEQRENPGRLGGWEEEDDRDKKLVVFDAHFLATSAYQMMLKEMSKDTSQQFHATNINLDEALNVIMTMWYRWKFAPETIQIEEDVIEVEKPIVKVSINIKHMLSSTRSFFDCRHSTSWNEEQMLHAQKSVFEADWLRFTRGPLSTLMANVKAKGQLRMYAMFNRHYVKLIHIFTLYAAADGGPFELGKYGAIQMFNDLHMITDPQEEEELEEQRQKNELLKTAEAKKNASATGNILLAVQKIEHTITVENKQVQQQQSPSNNLKNLGSIHEIQAPLVVLSARTSLEEFQQVWDALIAASGLMPDEGLRRHHFIGLLILLGQQRYRKNYTPAVSLRYMLTWEMCRGQIDYNPRKFRTDILYTPAITNVLSLYGHDLQTLFVERATSIAFTEFKIDTGSDYMTFEQFRDMLRARGLTDFAGVSEPHIRLAFIASQDDFVDESHTHPPGLLLDEMCEAIVRISYSMLLTAEERVARNKNRLKRVAKNRRNKRSGGGGGGSFMHVKRDEDSHRVRVEMSRIVSALKSTINILMGWVKASDDPNLLKVMKNVGLR
tara:strand:+ start:85 stop:5337 length:5253 start_codon:yes stop_codon:yes gene_type:complete